MSQFKTDDRVAIELPGLEGDEFRVIAEYTSGIFQLRTGGGEEFLMSTHLLRLIRRSPFYDKPGTVRRHHDMSAVKIRHDYWVIIRDNDEEALRFRDHELSNSPVIDRVTGSPAADAA